MARLGAFGLTSGLSLHAHDVAVPAVALSVARLYLRVGCHPR